MSLNQRDLRTVKDALLLTASIKNCPYLPKKINCLENYPNNLILLNCLPGCDLECDGVLAAGAGSGRGAAVAPVAVGPEPGEGDLLVDDELVAVADVVGVEQLARPLHLLGTRELYQILK